MKLNDEILKLMKNELPENNCKYLVMTEVLVGKSVRNEWYVVSYASDKWQCDERISRNIKGFVLLGK